MEEKTKALETQLLSVLGGEKLKEIGEQLAEVVVKHNLQTSPILCGELFTYMSGVIVGWNAE